MIDTTLPLTDIHRHLDGNIRPQTILELGRQYNISLPAQSLETLIPHVQVIANEPDLVSFLTKLDWGVKVLASLNADKLRLHTKGAATFTYAIDHRFDNTRYRQLMCHCHVAW